MKFRCTAILALGSISAQTCAEMPLFRATQFTLPREVTVVDSNSRGDVLYLQDVEGTRRTFIRSLDGTTRMLSAFTPEGYSVSGRTLDDNGNIGVVIGDAPGRVRVGFWSESEGYKIMPYPPGTQFSNYTVADMNNSGILAWFVEGHPSGDRGTWNVSTNEVMRVPATAGSIWLRDISEAGYMTGRGVISPYGAVFHADGTGYQLQEPGGTDGVFTLSSATLTVSNTGIVVGDGVWNRFDSSVFGTYIWDSSGNLLESNTNLNFTYSGISGSNLITGFTHNEPGRFRPFLYELGGQRVLIEDRIVEKNYTGELFGSPLAIHDNRSVFHQVHPGSATSPEIYVFLEPVPEPGTVIALGAGLAALLRRRWTT